MAARWRLGATLLYLPKIAHSCGGPGPGIPQGRNVPTYSLGKMMVAMHDEMNRRCGGGGKEGIVLWHCGREGVCNSLVQGVGHDEGE